MCRRWGVGSQPRLLSGEKMSANGLGRWYFARGDDQATVRRVVTLASDFREIVERGFGPFWRDQAGPDSSLHIAAVVRSRFLGVLGVDLGDDIDLPFLEADLGETAPKLQAERRVANALAKAGHERASRFLVRMIDPQASEVGLNGDDPSSRLRYTAHLSQDRAGILNVDQDARDVDAIEGGIWEGHLGGIANLERHAVG